MSRRLLHESRHDTFTAAERVAADLRRVWQHPEFIVVRRGRNEPPNRKHRVHYVRLYRVHS